MKYTLSIVSVAALALWICWWAVSLELPKDIVPLDELPKLSIKSEADYQAGIMRQDEVIPLVVRSQWAREKTLTSTPVPRLKSYINAGRALSLASRAARKAGIYFKQDKVRLHNADWHTLGQLGKELLEARNGIPQKIQALTQKTMADFQEAGMTFTFEEARKLSPNHYASTVSTIPGQPRSSYYPMPKEVETMGQVVEKEFEDKVLPFLLHAMARAGSHYEIVDIRKKYREARERLLRQKGK